MLEIEGRKLQKHSQSFMIDWRHVMWNVGVDETREMADEQRGRYKTLRVIQLHCEDIKKLSSDYIWSL